MSATIEQKVRNIIADQLGVGEEEIKITSSFIDDLGADSLDIVELVMAMEEEFEVEIPDEEAENIKTVQEERPRAARPGSSRARRTGARPGGLAAPDVSST